ncbi:MAG TPA: hypothetical protein VNZ52_11725 [Candidatus Thermoplasmatota archaeon]|nr:hypothetical protein [Candidatus Thermoplasmatota archaeon]
MAAGTSFSAGPAAVVVEDVRPENCGLLVPSICPVDIRDDEPGTAPGNWTIDARQNVSSANVTVDLTMVRQQAPGVVPEDLGAEKDAADIGFDIPLFTTLAETSGHLPRPITGTPADAYWIVITRDNTTLYYFGPSVRDAPELAHRKYVLVHPYGSDEGEVAFPNDLGGDDVDSESLAAAEVTCRLARADETCGPLARGVVLALQAAAPNVWYEIALHDFRVSTGPRSG